MSPPVSKIDELATALGYPGGASERLQQALTHKSFANEAGGLAHNERLEFLGDAVVGLLVAEALMQALPEAPEGVLSRLRASIVNARSLAELARNRGLGSLLRLGKGEGRTGGREKDSLLADAYEAVVGAVFLDLGLEAARAIVRADTQQRVAEGEAARAARDDKTQLQEWSQAHLQTTPRYDLVSAEGPDHEKVFTVILTIEGAVTATGHGKSKKAAERAAAAEAWAELARTGRVATRREAGGDAPSSPGTGSPSPASPPGGS